MFLPGLHSLQWDVVPGPSLLVQVRIWNTTNTFIFFLKPSGQEIKYPRFFSFTKFLTEIQCFHCLQVKQYPCIHGFNILFPQQSYTLGKFSRKLRPMDLDQWRTSCTWFLAGVETGSNIDMCLLFLGLQHRANNNHEKASECNVLDLSPPLCFK